MKESLRSLCCDMGNAYSRNFSLERLYSGFFWTIFNCLGDSFWVWLGLLSVFPVSIQ